MNCCVRTVTRFNNVHHEYCTSTAVDKGPSYRDLAILLESNTGNLATCEDVLTHLEKNEIPGAGQFNRTKIRRTKQCQEEMKLTSFHESFAYLQSTLGNLVERNPGSIADIQTLTITKADGSTSERFYRMYFILRSDIDIAIHCKPIVSFDAGPMKLAPWSKYQVMVCGMQDGDQHDCSVGFAVVPTEDEDNYRYFIQGLKRDIRLRTFLDQKGLLIITDRAKGLIGAIKHEFPRAHHRYCGVHILGNISKPSFAPDQIELYWSIVKSRTEAEFEHFMRLLRDSHKPAYQHLRSLDPDLWTDWKCPVPTWGLKSNNLAERAVKYMGTDQNGGRRNHLITVLRKYVTEVSVIV